MMISSASGHGGRLGSRLAAAAGHLYLALAGWRIEGKLAAGGRGVLIAAPHTSGWDLPQMLAIAWVYRVRVNWLGKHTLFEGRTGPLMRWLGGIPVDRRAAHGLVQQVVERFARQDALYLAIAPAGTRSQAKHWRSGFYHIAVGARVPIICGFLDYGRKVGGVGLSFVPSGDLHADMDRIRAFYQGIVGYKDGDTTVVALREELEQLGRDEPASRPQPCAAPMPIGSAPA